MNKFYKYFREELLTPLIKGLITLVVGVLIAFFWEYYKFKKEVIFSKKIELILESREKIEDLYLQFDRIKRDIWSIELKNRRDNDCLNKEVFTPFIEEMKSIPIQLDNISKFNSGVMDTTAISQHSKSFVSLLSKYKNCLETKTDCVICTQEVRGISDSLSIIIADHTQEINKQIGSNE